MERSTANAQELVAFLEQSPAVKEVLYTGRGGMISFKVADEKRIPHILNTLKVFSFAESLGGVESLITYQPLNPCRHSCRGSSFLWINR